MALLTDTDLITVRDLATAENDLLETADRERVEIETKIELGIADVRTEMETELGKISQSGAGGSALASAGNVVATPGLLRWARARILTLFYFECFGRQLNERFRVKFEHYQKQEEAAKRGYLERGIGVVSAPLPRPRAASLSLTPGAFPPGGCYFAVTWVNARGEQSALGTIGARVIETASLLTLEAPEAPGAANGWNAYLGNSPDQLYRQNPVPLALGASWPQNGPLGMEWPSDAGQTPDRYLRPERIFQRG